MHIDPKVLGLKDPRIQQLMSGVGSVQLLARTLGTPDWLLVTENDTITAMPQYQFATLVPVSDNTSISQQQLQDILADPDRLSQLSAQDRQELASIRKALDTCPVCKRDHYRYKVKQLLDKYNPVSDTPVSCASQYPQTSRQLPFVSEPVLHPVVQSIPRKACYDCIEKHVGQAYITGMEARMGYPSHIMLCYGHLAQAIQECPPDAARLRALLTLCLGVSKITGEGFVPLDQLYAVTQYYRNADQGSIATVANQQDYTYSLEHNIDRQLLSQMCPSDIDRLYTLLCVLSRCCTEVQNQSTNQHAVQQWVGTMANIAQLLAGYSLQAANAVRNIRLLFHATPNLMCQVPEYNLTSIKELLLQFLPAPAACSSTPDTTTSTT